MRVFSEAASVMAHYGPRGRRWVIFRSAPIMRARYSMMNSTNAVRIAGHADPCRRHHPRWSASPVLPWQKGREEEHDGPWHVSRHSRPPLERSGRSECRRRGGARGNGTGTFHAARNLETPAHRCCELQAFGFQPQRIEAAYQIGGLMNESSIMLAIRDASRLAMVPSFPDALGACLH